MSTVAGIERIHDQIKERGVSSYLWVVSGVRSIMISGIQKIPTIAIVRFWRKYLSVTELKWILAACRWLCHFVGDSMGSWWKWLGAGWGLWLLHFRMLLKCRKPWAFEILFSVCANPWAVILVSLSSETTNVTAPHCIFSITKQRVQRCAIETRLVSLFWLVFASPTCADDISGFQPLEL